MGRLPQIMQEGLECHNLEYKTEPERDSTITWWRRKCEDKTERFENAGLEDGVDATSNKTMLEGGRRKEQISSLVLQRQHGPPDKLVAAQ